MVTDDDPFFLILIFIVLFLHITNIEDPLGRMPFSAAKAMEIKKNMYIN